MCVWHSFVLLHSTWYIDQQYKFCALHCVLLLQKTVILKLAGLLHCSVRVVNLLS